MGRFDHHVKLPMLSSCRFESEGDFCMLHDPGGRFGLFTELIKEAASQIYVLSMSRYNILMLIMQKNNYN